MNPIYEMMMKNIPASGPFAILQRFQQFRNGFSGNAEQMVRQLLQDGRVSQQQYEQAVRTAQQLQGFFGK